MSAAGAAGPGELPELLEIERIVAQAGQGVVRRLACDVQAENETFAVPVIVLGNPSSNVPAVGFFGGVQEFNLEAGRNLETLREYRHREQKHRYGDQDAHGIPRFACQASCDR